MKYGTLSDLMARYWLTAEEYDYFYSCAESGCCIESLKEFLIRCWPEPDPDDFAPEGWVGTDDGDDDF